VGIVLLALLLPASAAATSKPDERRLTKQQATELFLAYPKVASWLERYPPHPITDATFESDTWTVMVWSGDAGEIATGTVDDVTGAVLEAWTGPQVAWKMARGGKGAFGGKQINSYPVWLGLCAAFLLGLVDWRRLASVRNVDLLMLLSFSVSLWFFNRGDIFTAVPLAYPGLVWLLARSLWVGRTDRASRGGVVWPVWVLAAGTVFLAGFRVMLNVRNSNVIDVGYAGVIGADRIWRGQSPYGNFPVEEDLPKCGPADASGEVRDRIQTNGRCENANPNGDTYGPFSYIAYLPGYLAFGWTGKWDTLPAAHATTILWDLLALVGIGLLGRRLGGSRNGPRLAATLAFAWVSWPFTLYAASSNTNDLIGPALLVWGFYFATTPALRGGFLALASWVKFAPLLLVPLWSGFPDTPRVRRRLAFLAGFVAATLLAFSVLLLDWPVWHTARVFWDRTIPTQVGRESPFSLWDWRQYHARGIPDLHVIQIVLQVLLVAGALALWRWPRRRSPLRLAALTAAVLIGFELVLTHWFFLYLPWFFPFVAIALLWERSPPAPVVEEADERAHPVLVAT
jgi:hypothetical protein